MSKLFHERVQQQLLSLSSSSKSKNNEYSDFPSEEEIGGKEFESEVDWDAEWKKVLDKKDQPKDRPSGMYKNDLELAALKAKRGVEDKLKDIDIPKVKPVDMRSLQGDWKFWVGILAIISVGTSLLALAGQSQVYTSDSYYI